MGHKQIRPGLLLQQRTRSAEYPTPPAEDADLIRRVNADPVAYAQLWCGRWLWRKQREVLDSIRLNKKTAVASGHGVGKSEIGGIAASWWMPTHPSGMIVTTAPTERQNVKILWARIRTLHALAARKRIRLPSGAVLDSGLGGELLIKEWKFAPDWFGVAVSAKQPENFAGWHADGGVLMIIEEASGVSDSVYEVANACVTGTKDRMLAIGNPTKPTGYFHSIWHNSTVMEQWHRIHMSCEDLTADDRKKIPGLVGEQWIKDLEKEWGRESDIFRVRALGLFPRGVGMILMQMDDICYAMARDDLSEALTELKPEDPRPIVGIGVDCSRGGEDEFVITRFVGEVQTHMETYVGDETSDSALMRKRVQDFYHKHGADIIGMDTLGLGGPIFDELKDLNYPVDSFVANAKPEEEPTAQATFCDLKTEAYYIVAMDVKERLIQLIEDDKLLGQLHDQPYEWKNGLMRVLSKEDRRRKLMKSPDRAEAVMICRWAQRRHMRALIEGPKGLNIVGYNTT